MSISRRQFIGCSAAIAAMAGGRVGNLVFAAENSPAATQNNVIVTVFLRGGMDGLSLVSPFDDSNYVSERGSLVVQNPLLLANPMAGATSNFGLHPVASGLHELYQSGKLAIVHAAGLKNDTRSHFDAMDYMERGTPGNKNTASGWLTRHLQTITADNGSQIPTLAAGAAAPASLLANAQVIATTDPKSYDLNVPYRFGPNSWNATLKDSALTALDAMYTGSDLVGTTGQRTIDTIKLMRSLTLATAGTYPSGGFSDSLKTVAQMIKMDVGLCAATVDLGGWDHHESQGVNEGYGPFRRLTEQLSGGLAAFYNDIAGHESRVTVVVMSEFGRRLGVNASNGTDHGHGNVMLVLGGQVKGGKMYGRWPGLSREDNQLDQGQDLAISTDYRTVLSEILVKQLGNGQLGTVFPGITPETYSATTSLNILNGAPVGINYQNAGGTVYLPYVRR